MARAWPWSCSQQDQPRTRQPALCPSKLQASFISFCSFLRENPSCWLYPPKPAYLGQSDWHSSHSMMLLVGSTHTELPLIHKNKLLSFALHKCFTSLSPASLSLGSKTAVWQIISINPNILPHFSHALQWLLIGKSLWVDIVLVTGTTNSAFADLAYKRFRWHWVSNFQWCMWILKAEVF